MSIELLFIVVGEDTEYRDFLYLLASWFQISVIFEDLDKRGTDELWSESVATGRLLALMSKE